MVSWRNIEISVNYPCYTLPGAMLETRFSVVTGLSSEGIHYQRGKLEVARVISLCKKAEKHRGFSCILKRADFT